MIKSKPTAKVRAERRKQARRLELKEVSKEPQQAIPKERRSEASTGGKSQVPQLPHASKSGFTEKLIINEEDIQKAIFASTAGAKAFLDHEFNGQLKEVLDGYGVDTKKIDWKPMQKLWFCYTESLGQLFMQTTKNVLQHCDKRTIEILEDGSKLTTATKMTTTDEEGSKDKVLMSVSE